LPRALQVEYLPLLDTWYVEEFREDVERLLAALLDDEPQPNPEG
jgi:hypothetical protein